MFERDCLSWYTVRVMWDSEAQMHKKPIDSVSLHNLNSQIVLKAEG